MNRVMCINDKDQPDTVVPVKVGDTYHVLEHHIRTCPCGKCFRIDYYRLVEMPDDCWYLAFRFVEWPEVSETEDVEAELEKVTA